LFHQSKNAHRSLENDSIINQR